MLKALSSIFLMTSSILLMPQTVAAEKSTGNIPKLVSALSSRTFRCELGNRVTVISDSEKRNQINLRWRGRTYRMVRVSTSTGANRYECKLSGLVWIDIPTKGILLNSRSGRQLANECRDYMKLRRTT